MYNIGDIVRKRYHYMGKRMLRFFLILDHKHTDFYCAMDLSEDGDVGDHWLAIKTELYTTKKVG